MNYSKFFGAKNPAPQQQTKLAFATKAKNEEQDDPVKNEDEGEGDVSAKENADPERGMYHSRESTQSSTEGIGRVNLHC